MNNILTQSSLCIYSSILIIGKDHAANRANRPHNHNQQAH